MTPYFPCPGANPRFFGSLATLGCSAPKLITALTTRFSIMTSVLSVSMVCCVLANSHYRTAWNLLRQSRRTNRHSSLKQVPYCRLIRGLLSMYSSILPYIKPHEENLFIRSESTKDAKIVLVSDKIRSASLRNLAKNK
jgi:hypothetical protein